MKNCWLKKLNEVNENIIKSMDDSFSGAFIKFGEQMIKALGSQKED